MRSHSSAQASHSFRAPAAMIVIVLPASWETDYRRRIQQYGLGYGSEPSKPVWVRDFPEWVLPLAERAAVDARFERFPENCVINEYVPPQGIGAHRDYPAFGPTVACISLGSDTVMEFTHAKDRERTSVHVPARSLWVITGEARYEWLHGIPARLTDILDGARRRRGRRISITFRTAKDLRLVPAEKVRALSGT